MKLRKNISVILLFNVFFWFHSALCAQEQEDSSYVFNPIIDDITQRIPALETLIDSAIENSPFLKNRYNEITTREYEFKGVQNELLKSFGFLSNMSWGRYNSSTLAISATDPTQFEDNSLRDQFAYSVGVYFRISLYDVFNRRNSLNIARKAIEASINSKEEQVFNIKKDIMIQYNNLILKQRLMKTTSDNLLTSEMRLVMVEKKFVNNQISLEEMSRLMEYHADTKTKYEVAKNEFMEAYLLLELSCGMKFNLLNRID